MEPNYAVAPGDYLQEFLDDTGTTQQQAADQLGYTRKHVSEILHGRAPVTPETATRLHRLTGIPAQSWLIFEAGYRADLARLQDEAALAAHVDDIPAPVLAYLRAAGHTTATRREPGRLVADFLAFHRCGTFEAFQAQSESLTRGDFALAALKESKNQPHPVAMSTWLRAAETTDTYQAARRLTYDEGALRALMPSLRERSANPDASLLTDLAGMLREVGVQLMFVEPPKSFPLHGVTRWIDKRVPVIQQTGRRGNDGFIIWTLFHEIGHVLNDPRGEVHLEYSTERKRNTAAEKNANAFAMSTLFGEEELAPFHGLTNDRHIASKSREVGVAPGLAVFMLRRRRKLPYNYGGKLMVELTPAFTT